LLPIKEWERSKKTIGKGGGVKEKKKRTRKAGENTTKKKHLTRNRN